MQMELLLSATRALVNSGFSVTSILTAMLLETSTEKQQVDPVNPEDRETSRKKQEFQLTELQARIAQELAIARRIELAHQVEIEEYYEGVGDGGIGLQASADQLRMGLHGSGSKVVKRVYRFKGFQSNETTTTEIEKTSTEQRDDEITR